MQRILPTAFKKKKDKQNSNTFLSLAFKSNTAASQMEIFTTRDGGAHTGLVCWGCQSHQKKKESSLYQLKVVFKYKTSSCNGVFLPCHIGTFTEGVLILPLLVPYCHLKTSSQCHSLHTSFVCDTEKCSSTCPVCHSPQKTCFSFSY